MSLTEGSEEASNSIIRSFTWEMLCRLEYYFVSDFSESDKLAHFRTPYINILFLNKIMEAQSGTGGPPRARNI